MQYIYNLNQIIDQDQQQDTKLWEAKIDGKLVSIKGNLI